MGQKRALYRVTYTIFSILPSFLFSLAHNLSDEFWLSEERRDLGTFFPFLGSFSSRQIENTINHCGVAEPGARSRPTPLSSFARAGAFDVTRSRQLLHSFKRYVFQSGSFFSETILGPGGVSLRV